MKTILFALSFASLSTLSTFVNASASSLTLAFPADPDYRGTLPSPTIWAEPIGTASDGSATTYVLNEIDSGDVALFGAVQTGTTVLTTSFTVIASASGYIFPDFEFVSVACTLDSSDSVVCVVVGEANVQGKTELVTTTGTGSPSLFIVPISTPTQTATSGSDSSSGSGSPSGSGSSTTSSSPSSTGLTSDSKNGAGQVGPRFLGLITAGLIAGAVVLGLARVLLRPRRVALKMEQDKWDHVSFKLV